MKHFIGFIFISGLMGVSLCLSVQTPAMAEPVIEMGAYLYLLQVPGSQWQYEDENGKKTTVEVMEPVKFNDIVDVGLLRMVTYNDDDTIEETVKEYYQVLEDGLYEIGTKEYPGDETTLSLSISFASPYKKVISLPSMDTDADPLVATGQGDFYYKLGVYPITGKADYSSSVDIEGVQTLAMPYGSFEVLKVTTTQTYSVNPYQIESTFSLYIEPNLGVLVIEDENDHLSLTGIANIPVPGDANDDGDVDGADLVAALVDGDLTSLARYFGVTVPIIVN